MKFLLSFFVFLMTLSTSVQSQCDEDDKSSLLRLKQSLTFNPSASTTLVSWNSSIDCCSWIGVTCSTGGFTIGLDISGESLTTGIHNSSSLFDLQHLQSLKFADNGYYRSHIPSAFGKLTNLRYLNLSHNAFFGQIPKEISHLKNLTVLDMSENYYRGHLKLENPNFNMLVQNLTELEELYLDLVYFSAQTSDWCQVISSSLPNLRVLSLSRTDLAGPFDQSLAKLSSLSVIRLDFSHIHSPVPPFFANFSNLTSLSLTACGLYGTFPPDIFQISTLQTISLSINPMLQGSLPEFPNSHPLQILDLSETNFSGLLPDSIGNLKMLSKMDLSTCSFYGSIPESMQNLSNLVILRIPENKFNGSIDSLHWENLTNLVIVDFSYNLLDGGIPLSMFSLPFLKSLYLHNNEFSNQFPEFSNFSSYQLATLSLAFNNFEGAIPEFIFDLKGLTFLSLSSNKLEGSFPLTGLQKLRNLSGLDLSYTSLFIDHSVSNSSYSSLPQLYSLKLTSTKLRNFPDFLRYQSQLSYLNLAENQIRGEIPNWIWRLNLLEDLNISCNSLESFERPFPNLTSALRLLDLHSNQLQGQIPVFPAPDLSYLDYSRNNLSSSIPYDLGDFFMNTKFLSLSSNNIHGIIPGSICKLLSLEVLNLPNNSLSGMIPQCLTTIQNLAVLNLRRNNLTANISFRFDEHCSLETLDLSGNQIFGQFPRSLDKCTRLKVLNLGFNQITDTFPCFLRNVSTLRVLVLRSNKFHGGIECHKTNGSWPMLQIIDLAHNNFNGEIPGGSLRSWQAMIFSQNDVPLELNHLQFVDSSDEDIYYDDSVTVVSKDSNMDLVKILTIFTAIDFSSNRFNGKIPEEFGEFKSLYILNLSDNAFTGAIPSALSNMQKLESLDLSMNKLIGEIPAQFGKLTFLSFLNLSNNDLVGKIPSSTQFSTFPKSSFEGNKGLSGPPLTEDGKEGLLPPILNGSDRDSGHEVDWDVLVSAEIGYIVGLGIVLGSLLFCNTWSNMYFKAVEDVAFKILPHLMTNRRGNQGRHVSKNRKSRH